jgi:hypothetical protein
VSSKVEGDKANLKLVVGDGKPVFHDNPLFGKTKDETKGECTMIIESGEWKIDKESWKTNSVSADTTPPPAGTTPPPAGTTPPPADAAPPPAGTTPPPADMPKGK